MNTPEIDVQIVYEAKPDDAVPYIRVAAIPRRSDFLKLPSGQRYKVKYVTFHERSDGKCVPEITVSPVAG